MKVHFKITDTLLNQILDDLRRPHPIAFERVGFVACGGGLTSDGLILVARSFHPVHDEDYESDSFVGAKINSRAIQRALALVYAKSHVMLFVHEHAHQGTPAPSKVDQDCWNELIPNFWHVRPELPHGALVLSQDRAMGLLWVPKQPRPLPITDFSVVGRQLQRWSEEECV